MEHRELSPVYGVCAVRLPDGVQEGNVSAALVKIRENRRPRADCPFCRRTAPALAAGQGGIPRPRRTAGAGGTTPPNQRSSVREPQPIWVGIPLF
ncbi:hypothetical protein CVT30_33640 [Streptomyces sp. AMCC400023]|nr:hypothetical protein CVT30_33640 [Streptomyces sp. AMCC400023]